MFKKIEEITINDLFNPEHFNSGNTGLNNITLYEITYYQHKIGLHRLVDLANLIVQRKIKINFNNLYKMFEIVLINESDYRDVLKTLFDTFYNNPNFIVNKKLIVKTEPDWIDESYEDCRLRNLWEIMDELGIESKHGYGKFISQNKKLKHYRPKNKIGEDNTSPLDLD